MGGKNFDLLGQTWLKINIFFRLEKPTSGLRGGFYKCHVRFQVSGYKRTFLLLPWSSIEMKSQFTSFAKVNHFMF